MWNKVKTKIMIKLCQLSSFHFMKNLNTWLFQIVYYRPAKILKIKFTPRDEK